MIEHDQGGDQVEPMSRTSAPTVLKALLRERNWHTYTLFKRAYEKAARRVDASLTGSFPGESTFKRWVAGRIKDAPYGEHRAVLEAMFPGWMAPDLFAPYTVDMDDADPILLNVLLKRRYLLTHRAFRDAYDDVARRVNSVLVGSYPAERTFYRWLSGEVIELPSPDQCGVLEAMFPGYTTQQLFEPYCPAPVVEGQSRRVESNALDQQVSERKRAYEIAPNRELVAAREAIQSKITPIPGAAMSRAELAEAVNAFLWRETKTRYALDEHAIGRYERGEVRWPSAAYRAGFRAVLGASSDTELGFYPTPRGAYVMPQPRPTRGTALGVSADVVTREDGPSVTTGEGLRVARTAAGLSLAAMAMRTHYTKPYLSLIETGKRGTTDEIVSAYERVLGTRIVRDSIAKTAPQQEVITAPNVTGSLRSVTDPGKPAAETNSDTVLGDDTHGEGHPVTRRSVLAAGGTGVLGAALLAPTRVLQALDIVASDDAETLHVAVDCLNELVSHYSERLFVATPAGMYDDLLQVRAYAGTLLGRSASATRQLPDLIVAAGWLSNLLAVATSYMGDHGSALVWCVDAQRRGDESGNRDIAGWAILTRAMIAYYQGRTARSAELAHTGLGIAGTGTAVHAKLAAHEMRARAMLGDAEGMTQAKTRATKAITGLSSDVATTGVFSIAPSEDPPYTATSLLLVNRFQEAAAATNNVIQARVSGRHAQSHRQSSSYARAQLILGLAKAGLGEIDEAAAVGRAALEGSGLVWPTLVLARKLDQALTRDHKDAPETADYHAFFSDTADRASLEFQRASLAITAKGHE